MGCCGDKAKALVDKADSIVKGYYRYAMGKKFEFTDDRIRTCQTCDKNYWIGRTLWCSICKCFVPAKARVESEKCPEGKWAK